jgi:thiol:disulfide interchange protein
VKGIRPGGLIGLVGLASLLFLNPARAQKYQGRELVQAQLFADTKTVVAGKPFTVGLLLHMVPGWHTYWKFPGDAGIPTEINWKLPAGWKVGEIQWPIPLKLNEPGDIQIYGYHDQVLLMQQIIPPETLTEPTARLSADASWLVCEKICIPGSTKVNLDLPVGGESTPANEDLFSRFRRLLPDKWPADAATARWSRLDSNLRLTIQSAALSAYPSVEFYPLPEGKVVVAHPSVEARKGNQVTFRVPIDSADKNLNAIKGLVVFAARPNGDNRAAWNAPEIAPAASANSASPGLVTLFFFGFIGGAILNLMPCVLPVISLKIFGFIQQAGQSRRKIFRSGLAFSAGIFAWFIALGLILIALKSAGHQISWAFQFTNPYFVFGMSVIVLVFALNLFGVFEISLPQKATSGMLGLTASEGETGSFFQGVFATLLATPCTAPYLGTALGFAFAQSSLIIMAMFLSIAAGMAFPYLLLCAQPGWLRFLPPPGAWMNHVKQFMGFLLLGTLVFLLYVIGAQRGLEGLIWTCSFLVIVSIVCWMKGIFLVPTASMKTQTIAAVAMVLLVVGGGFYFIGNKFRSAKLEAAEAKLDGDWQPFSAARLQAELDQGHAVFVDFTAAWCLNCKFNEAQVLENAAVREAFQRHGVTKLKADWTNGDPVITKFLQQFGRVGVPFYVLYPGKSGEPVVFPELLTKNIILEKLETISRTVASD